MNIDRRFGENQKKISTVLKVRWKKVYTLGNVFRHYAFRYYYNNIIRCDNIKQFLELDWDERTKKKPTKKVKFGVSTSLFSV